MTLCSLVRLEEFVLGGGFVQQLIFVCCIRLMSIFYVGIEWWLDIFL